MPTSAPHAPVPHAADAAAVLTAGALRARMVRAEVRWSETIARVTPLVEYGGAVVVLAPRRGGSRTFARQLCAHLEARYGSWTVRRFSARTLTGESVAEYMDRMRKHMPVAESGARLVVCIHGFSRRMAGDSRDNGGNGNNGLSAHVSALGNQLRAYLDDTGVGRPFSLVAVGGHPLYLLRHGEGELSAAHEETLPGLSAAQIAELLAQVEPHGGWPAGAATEVATRTGGHPHLVKALVTGWYEADGMTDGATDDAARWQAAERALEEDADYLHPTLAAVAANPDQVAELRQWLTAERVRRKFDARWPGHELLYSGLLRQERRDLLLRCPVVKRLVCELLQGAPCP